MSNVEMVAVEPVQVVAPQSDVQPQSQDAT